MTAYNKLIESQSRTNTRLCVGLDPDVAKLPEGFGTSIEDVVKFTIEVIEATEATTPVYKINFAFFEKFGSKGFEAIETIMERIPENIFTIADAKRGDIGNTSKMYADSVFSHFNFDAITLSPYMGSDSVEPFLEYEDKMIFLLARTSNKGGDDFQNLISDGKHIYEHVVQKSSRWASDEQIGYVAGATRPDELAKIRKLAPKNVLLIPGVGAQGGDLESVLEANGSGTAIINVSRGVIFPKIIEDYQEDIFTAGLMFAEILRIND